MNYSEFLQQYQTVDKELSDAIKKVASLQSKMKKSASRGDFKALVKDKEALGVALETLKGAREKVDEVISSFDAREYFVSGQFAENLVAELKDKKLDVIGEFPVYEIFPTRIRIDSENQDVILGKKKVPTMSPLFLATTTSDLISKLDSASFNATAFAQDLENAYNTCLLAEGKKQDGLNYVSLINCYKAMVPLARSRKDYDEMAFAYDLARLFNAIKDNNFTSKSGKTCMFGTGRGKAIRILDNTKMEQLISTVCFR